MNTIAVELTPQEIRILLHGLSEWSGPAFATGVLAIAMGFMGLDHMTEDCRRLARSIAAKEPLSAEDWSRALAATEVAFVSEVWGSGLDWATTYGVGDEETIKVLRGLQSKLERASAITRPSSR